MSTVLDDLAELNVVSLPCHACARNLRLDGWIVLDEDDWRRGGAETYIRLSMVRCSHGLDYRVISKALTAFGASSRLTEILSRREDVRSLGVSTPELYAYGSGLIIEEMLPVVGPNSQQGDPLSTYRRAAVEGLQLALEAAGYYPIGLSSNVGFRRSEVTARLFDFGSDLGARSESPAGLGR